MSKGRMKKSKLKRSPKMNRVKRTRAGRKRPKRTKKTKRTKRPKRTKKTKRIKYLRGGTVDDCSLDNALAEASAQAPKVWEQIDCGEGGDEGNVLTPAELVEGMDAWLHAHPGYAYPEGAGTRSPDMMPGDRTNLPPRRAWWRSATAAPPPVSRRQHTPAALGDRHSAFHPYAAPGQAVPHPSQGPSAHATEKGLPRGEPLLGSRARATQRLGDEYGCGAQGGIPSPCAEEVSSTTAAVPGWFKPEERCFFHTHDGRWDNK